MILLHACNCLCFALSFALRSYKVNKQNKTLANNGIYELGHTENTQPASQSVCAVLLYIFYQVSIRACKKFFIWPSAAAFKRIFLQVQNKNKNCDYGQSLTKSAVGFDFVWWWFVSLLLPA